MNEVKLKPMEDKPEAFYHQKDSAYLRIQYLPELHSYRFTVRNELLSSADSVDKLDDGAIAMSTLIRGLAEAAIFYSSDMYNLGLEAQQKDFLEVSTENMPEDHAKALRGEPKGIA